jgi:hypothetical protein
MAEPTIRSNVDQTLDVHRNFAPEVTLNAIFFIDNFAQPEDFIVGQVTDARVRINTGSLQQGLTRVEPNSENVCQPNFHTLFAGQVNS